MSTHEVMFRAGSKPPDEGKGVEGGGGCSDHPVPEIRGGPRAPPLNPPLIFNRRTEVYLG